MMDEKVGGRGLLVACLFVPPIMVLRGWVLGVLWGWFVEPVFGAPSLSIAEAIGLAAVVSFLTYQHRPGGKTVRELIDYVFFAATWPFIALASGWAVTLFL